ncbi:MAG: Fic family protein [Candidatus Binatia bacterium]
MRGSHLTPGELRTSQNWIGPGGCTLNEAAFVPPPPYEVPQHLTELEKFIHTNTGLPLLIKIGLVHAQFETIHPFLDGNGRIGRLLITFLLCEQQMLLKPVLYLSYFFKQHRQQYYEQLQSVRDAGTWEQWLAFFLRGIVDVSGQATDTARRILDLREAHRRAITEHLGRAAGNGHRVLEHLYEHPILSVSEVQDLIGTTYPAANDLVARMVNIGIVREFTGQARNRKFIYKDYIQLFHDDESEVGA